MAEHPSYDGVPEGGPLIRAAGATKQMAKALMGGMGGPAASASLKPVWSELKGRTPEKEKGSEIRLDGGADQDESEDGPRIRHCLTGLVHRGGTFRGPPDLWTTKCGWRWATLGVAGSFDQAPLCARCFGQSK